MQDYFIVWFLRFSTSSDNFMNGLYRMFLGDARPNHSGDEWVFQDVDSIQDIIIPAARISLKVHQVGGASMGVAL